jgi:hypothetical protein
MYIETACPGCGRKLRVAADQAGKAARCPICSTIYNVPDSAASASVATSASERSPLWQLKTPEGQIYGPVSREILDQWVAQGRISADCSLMCESDGIWQDATVVYPVLQPVTQPVRPTIFDDNPVSGLPQGPRGGEVGRVRVLNGHRGGLILALGIISWAVGCPIFGIMAWIMGSSDMRDMQRGMMDPSGRGITQAGQIIGMVHVLLALLVLVAGAFVFLVFRVLK